MRKSITTADTIASIVAGAVTWFVLDVIFGIAVWVAFVAGGGVLVVGAFLAVGAGAARAGSDAHRPQSGAPLGAS